MRAELLAEFRAQLIRQMSALLGGLFVATAALAQQTCTNGIGVDGTITDQTGALVAGARVQSAQGQQTTTDIQGRFVLPCVPSSSTTISVQADGFAPSTSRARAVLGGTAHLTLQLAVAAVQADVELFIRGGLAILRKIEAQGYNVWHKRPALAKWEKATLLAGALWRRLRPALRVW